MLEAWTNSRSGFALLAVNVLAAGAIFALQLVPVVGPLLMWFGAAFWMHSVMVQFACFAVMGTISRAWLALPIGFYAGGFVLHLYSVRAAEAEAAAVNARNSAVRLTVDQPFRYLSGGSAGAFELLEHYRVDRTFLRQGNGSITTHYYARGDDCDNASRSPSQRSKPWAIRSDIFHNYPGPRSRQCILSQDGLPAEWRYRITADYIYEDDQSSALYQTSPLFKRHGKKFDIFDERENRLLGTIEVVSFTPLSALPWIVAGCNPGLGGSKSCIWFLAKRGTPIQAGYKARAADDPQKNQFVPSRDPDTWEITQLARVLGLEMRQPND